MRYRKQLIAIFLVLLFFPPSLWGQMKVRINWTAVTGAQIFKTNKAVGIRVLGKYTRVKEQDILEDAYLQFREYLESIPYVSRKGMESILAELAEKDPAAKQAKPEDFLEMRFVAELEKGGFLKKLWGTKHRTR